MKWPRKVWILLLNSHFLRLRVTPASWMHCSAAVGLESGNSWSFYTKYAAEALKNGTHPLLEELVGTRKTKGKLVKRPKVVRCLELLARGSGKTAVSIEFAEVCGSVLKLRKLSCTEPGFHPPSAVGTSPETCSHGVIWGWHRWHWSWIFWHHRHHQSTDVSTLGIIPIDSFNSNSAWTLPRRGIRTLLTVKRAWGDHQPSAGFRIRLTLCPILQRAAETFMYRSWVLAASLWWSSTVMLSSASRGASCLGHKVAGGGVKFPTVFRYIVSSCSSPMEIMAWRSTWGNSLLSQS